MTFWAWLAQCMANLFVVILVKFMFGKDKFAYQVEKRLANDLAY